MTDYEVEYRINMIGLYYEIMLLFKCLFAAHNYAHNMKNVVGLARGRPISIIGPIPDTYLIMLMGAGEHCTRSKDTDAWR
jgi:hypothetical protein